MKLIQRKLYLDRLLGVKGTPDIKVITGIRRAGKSKLLESFINLIENIDPKANIIRIDFNDIDFDDLKDYKTLHEYVMHQYRKTKNNYLFIDEVQLCSNFELAINSLHSKELFDIYITGSNAFMLSSDLATLFTGRTYQIEVFPFSFAEYSLYYEKDHKDRYENFNDYLFEGGFAGSYLYKTIDQKYSYINKEIIETIIERDLIDKYKIRNTKVLNSLVDFMLDNASNLTSSNSITTTLVKKDEQITNKTVSKYIDYLCKAFIVTRMNRYDLKGKTYLVTDNKYYLADTSLRYAKLGTKNLDRGRMIENVVALELLRRGYDVYVGKLYKKEIDFVATKWNEKMYIQVSDNINDEVTFHREIEPLTKIRDSYRKMIIASTRQPKYDYEGIEIVDVADWLLSEGS